MTRIPKTVKVMVLTGHGGLDKYGWREDCPVPEVCRGDVLIKVGACGLNSTAVNTRIGWYSKAVTVGTTSDAYAALTDDNPTWGGSFLGFPRSQGADAVGRMEAVGEGVEESLIGGRFVNDGWVRDPADSGNQDVKPLLAATYPLSQLRKAQATFIVETPTGNIVVNME